MRNTGRIILGIAMLSGLMLLYVHQQIALFRVSYRIDEQYELVTRKSEDYRQIKFEVDQLKSPRLLEGRMKELELDLRLPKEVQVVRIPHLPVVQELGTAYMDSEQVTGHFLSILGRWTGVAQAKTER
ncbi:MAG: hypothetical protein JW893_01840 [Candidatus Omnitrophica bacterium]|nr:hypothetical protein [Candidatus Omnitrophota bacterium]